MTERRTARRYDLSLPVIIRVPVDREASSRNGKTRDISTRGVYFTIDEELGPGAELDITLTLPAEVTRGSEVFIRAMGKVVRVDKNLKMALRVSVSPLSSSATKSFAPTAPNKTGTTHKSCSELQPFALRLFAVTCIDESSVERYNPASGGRPNAA